MTRKLSDFFILFIICINPMIITPWNIDYYYQPKVIIIYIFCCIILFSYSIIDRGAEILILQEDRLFLIYIGLLCISTLFSVNFYQSLSGRAFRYEGFVTILCYFIIFEIAKRYYNFSLSHLKYILISSVIISLYGIIQYFGFDPIPVDPLRSNWIKRAYSTIGNPNFLGSYLILFLPVSLFAFVYSKKTMYLFISSILYTSLLCTKTRSAWLGFLFSIICLFYLIKKYKFNYRQFLIAFSVFASITITFNVLNNNDIFNRFNSIIEDASLVITNSPDENYAGTKRIFIWKKALILIGKKPIIGYGPDTFDIAFMGNFKDESKNYFGNIIVDKAHNEYIQIAVTSGVPALIIYLCLISLILMRLLKSVHKNILLIPLICSITGYLIQAFFNISVVSVAPIFWALLGVSNSLEFLNCSSTYDNVSIVEHN